MATSVPTSDASDAVDDFLSSAHAMPGEFKTEEFLNTSESSAIHGTTSGGIDSSLLPSKSASTMGSYKKGFIYAVIASVIVWIGLLILKPEFLEQKDESSVIQQPISITRALICLFIVFIVLTGTSVGYLYYTK